MLPVQARGICSRGSVPEVYSCVIFDVKQDMRQKARLVAGGHLVVALDHNIYSSPVKGISVKLLHVIAHKAGLRQFCGNVVNAYVIALTNEKVYASRT